MRRLTLSEVLDLDLAALRALQDWSFENSTTQTYHRVLLAYLSGDLPELSRLIRQTETSQTDDSESEAVACLARLRLQLLLGAVDPSFVAKVQQLTPSDPHWRGEVHFVLAHAKMLLNQHEESRNDSVLAARWLDAVGAKRKALRAWLNAKAADAQVKALRPRSVLRAPYAKKQVPHVLEIPKARYLHLR